MTSRCDCEHNTHDPKGVRQPTEHEFGEGIAVAAIKTPWGGTFHLCQACLDSGHMQGTQFR